MCRRASNDTISRYIRADNDGIYMKIPRFEIAWSGRERLNLAAAVIAIESPISAAWQTSNDFRRTLVSRAGNRDRGRRRLPLSRRSSNTFIDLPDALCLQRRHREFPRRRHLWRNVFLSARRYAIMRYNPSHRLYFCRSYDFWQLCRA